MKLKLFVAALLLGPAMSVSAQDIYSENFEGTPADIIDEGWRFFEIHGDSQIHGILSSVPQTVAIGIEGASIGVASYNMVNQTMVHVADIDFALTSPVITLPAGESYYHYRVGSIAMTNGASSNYSVYVLTESEAEAAATPAQLKTLLDSKWADDSATITAETNDVSTELTDFAGQSIVLVFRIHNNPANSVLLFDNLSITAGALATGDFEKRGFVAYPNPATDIITVNAGNNSAINAITITDLNGRSVLSKQVGGLNSAVADLSGLSNGIYMMTVVSDRGTTTQKIVKQ